MDEIEMLYFEKEMQDIKKWCQENGHVVQHKGREYYLYCGRVYDENMTIVSDDYLQGE